MDVKFAWILYTESTITSFGGGVCLKNRIVPWTVRKFGFIENQTKNAFGL